MLSGIHCVVRIYIVSMRYHANPYNYTKYYLT